jgi:Zn-dependent protease
MDQSPQPNESKKPGEDPFDSAGSSKTKSDLDSRFVDDKVIGWLSDSENLSGSTSSSVSPSSISHSQDGDTVQVGVHSWPDPTYVDAPVVRRRYRRRYQWPVALFLLTCISTFFVGVTWWSPLEYFALPRFDPGADGLIPLRRMIISHWQDGLVYMAAVLAILLAHEMGHFVATVRHRIAASLPFFLPLPITPIGTLGAVIGMDGLRANRKQIFDIGLAGPLAGLVVAVPILWAGISQLDMSQDRFGMYKLDMPLIMRWMASAANVPGYETDPVIWQGQLNPLLMAGWVGLIVTGWNMFPVSQLDGGHVIYSLFGRRSRWIARLFIVTVVAYMVLYNNYQPLLMVGLILLIGVDHPPTSDDTVQMGTFRLVLGYLSLLIPILCFPPRLMIMS